MANINTKELGVYKELSKELLTLDEKVIMTMIKMGTLLEVK